MRTGNIRPTALAWFRLGFPSEKEKIYSSKFYIPQESWSKSSVWFFQIPTNILNLKVIQFIHLLCENHLQGASFLYLKVPVSFILLNLEAFDIDKKQKIIRMYLSAEAVNMFREVRKSSKLDFTKFVQNLNLDTD